MLRETNPPKLLLVFAFGLSLIETATGLIVPLLTKSLVDQLAAATVELTIIAMLFGVFLLQAVSAGLSYFLMSYIGEGIVRAIRKRLWKHVLNLPVSFFDRQQSGEIMSRITQDTSTVKDLITMHLVTFISGVISVVGAVIILFWIDWKMTLIMLISVPLSLVIILPLGNKMYRISLACKTGWPCLRPTSGGCFRKSAS